MLVTVCYIENGDCLRLQGMVAAVRRDARQLQIVKTRIPFDAIVDLSGEALDEDPFADPIKKIAAAGDPHPSSCCFLSSSSL